MEMTCGRDGLASATADEREGHLARDNPISQKCRLESPGMIAEDSSATEAQRIITYEGTVDDLPPPNASTPITYLYLTFDTPVAGPDLGNPQLDRENLPACPDLSRYTDPLSWPWARKGVMVAISCVATCFTAYAAGAYSESVDLIAADLKTTREGALVGVTTFCLGFAIAPMVLAPFSEINGRYPVFAIAGILFVVFQAVCGVVRNLAGMLIARFLKGVGGSVFSTMVGGVIADMYEKEGRNTPMALFSGAVLVGTGLGPLVAAVMVQRWGKDGDKWKWIFWHQVIIDFILMVAVVAFFNESRGSVLLCRKAKVLNMWYTKIEEKGVFGVCVAELNIDPGVVPRSTMASTEKHISPPGLKYRARLRGDVRLQRIRWIVKEDEHKTSIATMVTVSLFRPFLLLFTEPIVFFFSLWVSFAWAILYLTFGSIPLVFQRQYGFNVEQSGYVFTAMIIGSIFSTIIGICQESMLKHPRWQSRSDNSDVESSENSSENLEENAGRTGFWVFARRRFPVESPESRLYFACFTSVLLPAGLFLFGFAAQPSIHWMVPAFAIFLATMGIFYVYLATFNYLADIYQTYASSALAAQSFCRNVLGGAFPLVTAPLIRNLGEDATGGLLGGIATVLTVVPWVLVLFGEKIRGRSSFAIALERK
ncbi:MFS general substrate transporter [Annulohypoxylon maeteangense]|uniref:MFS general substrate transporter n=1 Tax=Annulohypoxylon maeteangense TaxID=1927788 RepID=UPI002008B386|nr:MFS general substrate transporter [Annulohypoxylon maeteangense]KAI0881394.1 MFS general substrate transporter [Annulohypoxylon maeteangense]